MGGRYLALASSATPFVVIYDWQSGAPVRIADPSVLPGGSLVYDADWSRDGRYLVITSNGAPYATIYDAALQPPAGQFWLPNIPANPLPSFIKAA